MMLASLSIQITKANMVYFAKIQIYYWYEFTYYRKIIQLFEV